MIIKNQDSMILGYIGGCHRNPKFWAKPNEFYPEHFLDENGKLRHNIEGYLPFSIGISLIKLVKLIFAFHFSSLYII